MADLQRMHGVLAARNPSVTFYFQHIWHCIKSTTWAKGKWSPLDPLHGFGISLSNARKDPLAAHYL